MHVHTVSQADNDEAARLWKMLLQPVLPVILMFSRTTSKQELHRSLKFLQLKLPENSLENGDSKDCAVRCSRLLPPSFTAELVEKSTNNQAHVEAIWMKMAAKGHEDTAT